MKTQKALSTFLSLFIIMLSLSVISMFAMMFLDISS